LKKGIGFKDLVSLGEREIQIHTGNDPNKNLVRSEVFEKGQFLFSNQNAYDYRNEDKTPIEEDFVKASTRKLHNETIDEIKILFYVHEKIKLLRKQMPHFRLGKVFYAKRFYQEAVENLARAVDLKPDFIAAYKYLGLSYILLQDFEHAVGVLAEAHKQQPTYPDLLNCLGVAYAQKMDFQGATQHVQKAIDIRPDYLEANFNLGIILFLSTLQDASDEENVIVPARVMRTFKSIKNHERYQNDLWQAKFADFFNIIESGNRKKIIEELLRIQVEIITTKDESMIMDYFFLKFMYGGRELTKHDLEFYEHVIKTEVHSHEQYADFWNELGVIHLIQCRDFFLKAINEFEKALKINPAFDGALKNFDLLKHNKSGFLILLRAILR
jgi:tetratricopeptide (TPR) repeat protein